MKVSKRLGFYEFTDEVTISLVQGNLLYSHQDLRVPGIIPVRFNRTYTSEDSKPDPFLYPPGMKHIQGFRSRKSGPFGHGWSHEYNRSLEIHEEYIVYLNEHLQPVYFVKNEQGQWYSPTLKRAVLKTVPGGYTLVLIPGQTYRFNTEGQLVSMEYRDGNALRFEHEQGRLCRIINPSGRTLHLTYNNIGYIASAYIEAEGAVRRVSYEYDNYSNLTSVTDAMGNTTTYGYRDWNMQRVTDAEGRSLYFMFDSNDRVVKAWTDKEAGLKTILYDTEKNVTTLIDGKGAGTKFFYDENGMIVREQFPDGNEARYKWDGNGQLIQVTRPGGKDIYLAYDKAGNLISEKAPGLGTSRYVYNRHRQLVRSVAPGGQTASYFYDEQGNLTQVVEPGRRVTRFEYGSRGLLLKSIDPGGGKREFQYDEDGNVTEIKDEMGYITRLQYDRWGWLKTVIQPDGGRTEKQLDENNLEVKVTRPDGSVVETLRDRTGAVKEIIQPGGVKTAFTYDVLGRLTGITDPMGKTITYQYDAANNLVKVTNVNGSTVQTEFDPVGRPVRILHPDGGMETMSYDAAGRLREQTGPEGHVTCFQYNARDQVTKVVDAAGHSRTYTYNIPGQLVQAVDENGNRTTHSYTPEGWLWETRFPDGGKISRGYDRMGNMIYAVDQGGHRTENEYDAINRLIRTKDALGGTRLFEYDARGNLTAATDEAGERWENKYDLMGRKIVEIDPSGAARSFAYDERGNLVVETDPLGHVTRRVYDPLGRMMELIRTGKGEDGKEVETRDKYEYDAAGSPVKITDANGNTTKLHYDAAGRLTKMVNPLGQEENYIYDRKGQMVSRKDFDGDEMTYRYDPLGRVTNIMMPGNRTEGFSYTPGGLLARVKSGNFEAEFDYDVMDRLTRKKIITPFSAGLNYKYDKRGSCLSVRDDNGAEITYRYDALGRMTMLEDSECGKWEFGYTAAGLRERVIHPNQVTTHYTYDPVGRPVKLVTGKDSQVLEQLEYEYDRASRLVTEEGLKRTRKHKYDPLGRLIEVTDKDRESGGMETFSYRYDPAGNRTQSKQGNQRVQYSYDADNRLLKAGETGFVYDANGRRTAKMDAGEKTSYAYDGLDRLIGVTLPGGESVTFDHEPDGDRILKRIEKGGKAEEVHYLHDGPHVLRELVDGKTANRFVHGPGIDNLLCINTAAGPNYVIPDIRGSVCGLTDAKGTLTQRFDYGPFGGHSPSDAAPPFSFTGREYDRETALHYYRARYYDASVGRFLSKDPAGFHDGLNLYPYCASDPVNHTDPSGNFLVLFGLGFILGVGIDYAVAYCRSRHNSISDYYWSGEYSVGRAVVSGTAGGLSMVSGGLIAQTGWGAGRMFLANVVSDTAISTLQSAAISHMEGESFNWGENFVQNLVFNGLLHGLGYGLSRLRPRGDLSHPHLTGQGPEQPGILQRARNSIRERRAMRAAENRLARERTALVRDWARRAGFPENRITYRHTLEETSRWRPNPSGEVGWITMTAKAWHDDIGPLPILYHEVGHDSLRRFGGGTEELASAAGILNARETLKENAGPVVGDLYRWFRNRGYTEEMVQRLFDQLDSLG